MYCVKCGQQLPDDARFCSKCGTETVPQNGVVNRNQRANDSVGANAEDFVAEKAAVADSINARNSVLKIIGRILLVLAALYVVGCTANLIYECVK